MCILVLFYAYSSWKNLYCIFNLILKNIPETFNDMGEYKCHYKVEDTYYDQRRRWVVKKIVI